MTAQEFFKNDRFATNAGVELIEIKEGYSKARPGYHGRASQCGGRTQGGAIFTLCRPGTGSSSQLPRNIGLLSFVQYHLPAQQRTGDVLYAEARERYIGRTTGYYQIDVTNQEGKLIATFESSVFRKGITSLFLTTDVIG